MKKLFLVIIAFILMCCEIKVEPSRVNASNSVIDNLTRSGTTSIRYDKYLDAGITYGVFYVANGTSQTGYGIHVVNLTKERLEIDKLVLEIEKLNFEKEQRTTKTKK